VCWYMGGHHSDHTLISDVVRTIRAITNKIQRAIRLRCDDDKIDTTGGVLSCRTLVAFHSDGYTHGELDRR
jgi:hypothetical protein